MGYTVDELADLILLTLDDLGEGSWEDLASQHQRYFAMPQLLREERITYGSGTGFQWNMMIDDNQSARNVGTYSKDELNFPDVMTQARGPWRHTEGFWGWDVLEFKTNTGDRQILNLIKTKRAAGYISQAGRMETDFWGFCSQGDETTPWGVFNWFVFRSDGIYAATSTGGFVAANPYGYTTGIAGIDRTSVTRANNWCQQYVTVDEDDLYTKMRTGADYTYFMPPIEIPRYAKGMDRAYYTVHSIKSQMERDLRTRNDNIGYDLTWGDGEVLFRGAPVFWVPELDRAVDAGEVVDKDGTALSAPILQQDWDTFKIALLEDDYLEESPPTPVAGMHRVVAQFLDTTWNTQVYNLRGLAIYAL